MTIVLEKLNYAFFAALILAVAVLLVVGNGSVYALAVAVWLHVVSGVLWIGLLWYFNLVQIPTMPKIPAELKPAVGKFIAPSALFWFRYAALATVITGLAVAGHKGYLVAALTFDPGVETIGVGMYLGLIMAFNVWFIIWPNQKIALGIVEAEADAKAAAARTAMLTSRINSVLSLAMLYCMVAQNIAGK